MINGLPMFAGSRWQPRPTAAAVRHKAHHSIVLRPDRAVPLPQRQHGDAGRSDGAVQIRGHFCADGAGGLVQDGQRWLLQQQPCDGQPLHLADGQLT